MTLVAILIHIVVTGVALWVTTLIVPGIEVGGATTGAQIGTLLIVALIFGIVNTVIKPIVKVLGCLFYLITLGLIAFVVNALLFLLVGWIGQQFGLPFTVDGFWPAFWGAIVVGVVSWILHLVIPDRLDDPSAANRR